MQGTRSTSSTARKKASQSFRLSMLALCGLSLVAFSSCKSPFGGNKSTDASFHPGVTFDRARSMVSLSNASVRSGSQVTFTMRAMNQNGEPYTSNDLRVSFSTQGGTSIGSISSVTNAGNGVYTATFTAIVSGSASTVVATVNDSALTSTLPAVTVFPGDLSLAQSAVSLSAATINLDAQTQVTLTTRDAAGNQLTSGGLNVAFQLTSGAVGGSFSAVTDRGDGTYTSTFTGTFPGTSRIGATVGGTSVTSDSPSLHVLSDASNQTVISTSTTQINSSSSLTVTVTAYKQDGTRITIGGSIVTLSASGGSSTGTFSSITDHLDGTYTATFTGVTSGTPTTISGVIDGIAITTTLPTVKVDPGPLSLSRTQLVSSVSTIASGSSANLTLVTLDANGNQLGVGGLNVVISAMGTGSSTGIVGTVIDQGNGTYTATYTGVLAGTAKSLSANLNGSQLTSTLPTVAVTAGPASLSNSIVTVPSSVASGSSVTLTLFARDAAGNACTAGGLTVAFGTSGGTSTGNIGSITPNADGSYTAPFTGVTAGTQTTITGTIGGASVTSTLPGIVVTAGPPSLNQSILTISSGTVTSGGAVTATLTVKDANGNILTAGGQSVGLSFSGGTSTGVFGPVSDLGNGTYTAVFTALTSGTATSLSASIAGSTITSTLPTVTVVPGNTSPANSIIQVNTASSASVASGSTAQVKLIAKDGNGNAITTGGLTVVFGTSGGTSTGSIGAVTDHNDGTYTATFTGATAGTALAITGTMDGSTITSTLPTVTVTTGSASLSQSTLALSSSTVSSGSSVTLTLTTRDSQGNQLSSGGLSVTFAHTGGTSTGNFSAVSDLGDGTYRVTFTGATSGTTTAITAYISGNAVTSSHPNITVNPGVVSLSQSQLTVSSSSVPSGSSVTLTLTTRDTSGNALTSGGLLVAFSRQGGSSAGTFASATDVGNGTYTATFTGTQAGTATTLRAAIAGNLITSTLPTVTVTASDVSLSKSTISVSNQTVSSGSAITLTLTAKDSFGNLVGAGGNTIVFSHSGGSSTGTIGSTTDQGDGTYTATFTGVLTGTATSIGASIDGNATTGAKPSVTVVSGGISAALSTIAVSSATMSSGGNITVTLTSRDGNNNPLSTGGATVVFSHSGGTSTGVFGATQDNGDGTYSAVFTGSTVGSATSIGATIDGVAVSSALPTVTVEAGAVSLAQSTIAVSSTSVSSGSGVTLTLTAKDAQGNILTDGGLTVVFAYSGGTSTGNLSAVTDNVNGTYTATLTGVVAGTASTVSATIGGNAVTSTLPTVTVVPGSVSLSQSAVTTTSAIVTAGGSTDVILTAKDANGNRITSGGLTVAFSISGGTSSGTFAPVSDNGDGTYTSTFSGTVAGTATTVECTIGASTVTSAMPTITVEIGSSSSANSVVTVSSSLIASGATTTLTLTAYDGSGNPITTGGQTVVFSHSGGGSTGTISATTDVGDGTYTATFTGVLSGSATTIRATLDGSNVTTTLPTVTVTPGTISAAHSVLTSSLSTLASGSNTTLTLVSKDAQGNLLTSGGAALSYSHSGGTATGTIGSTTDLGNGTYTAIFTGLQKGTATTIHVNINGVALSTTLPTVAVTPGPVSTAESLLTVSSATVQSGSTVTLTLTAKDANGNTLTSGGLNVTFGRTGGTSTGTLAATTDNNNGTYTSVLTGVVAGTPMTLTASIGGTAITSTLPTLTVTSGSASLSQSTLTAQASSVASDSNVTLTLVTKDSNGNSLTAGGLTVVFAASGGTSTGTISATTDNGDGTYTASFTGLIAGTATTIGATIGGAAVTSTSPAITVTPGPTSLSQSLITVSSATVNSGANVTVTLTTKDAHSNLVTTGGLTVSFSRTGGTSTGNFDTVVDHNNGVYSALFTGVNAGTATTIQGTIGGLAITSASPTITVQAGAATVAGSTVTTSASTVTSGSDITLTLSAKDANGNALTSGGLTVLFGFSGGTSTGTIGSVTDVGDGTYTATFTGLASGTATTITATIGGAAVTSTLPTVTVNAGNASLSQSTISVSASTVSSGSTVTATLTAKDANGNALPGGGLTIAFGISGGTSSGTYGTVTDNGNGTYTAVFTGSTAGTATTVTATIGGAAVTSNHPSLQVLPGAISLQNSLISVSSATVVSGSNITLTLTGKDANNNALTAGGSTVVFSYSGGTSTGSIGSTTDNNNGTYTATFTGVTAGSATGITATVGGGTVTSASPTVTVSAGAASLSNSILSVSSASVSAGSAVSLTLTAKDSNNNQLPAGGLSVVFSNTGGTSTGTMGSTTDNNNGTYTTTFTGVGAGTATTLRATIGGSLITSTLPTLTVTAGNSSGSNSIISVSSSSVVSGSSVNLLLTVKDASGNAVTTGGAIVAFSASGGVSTGTISSTTDNGNGTYSATFTGVTAGSATTIHATLDGTNITSTLPTIAVTPGAYSLAQSLVSVSSSTVVSGANINVTLTAKDTNGNTLSGGGLVVTFSHTGGVSTGTFGSTTDNSNGTYTTTFTGVTAGSATSIRGTIVGGGLVTSASPSVTVTPGAVSLSNSLVSLSNSTVVSGSTLTFTLTAKDSNNNTLSGGGLTVVFSHTGGTSTGTFGSTTDHSNGTYTAVFTGVTAGTATTGRATIGGNAVTSTLPTLTVTPGAFALSKSLVSVSSATATSGNTVTLTMTAKDLNNNTLSGGGLTIAFARSTGAGVSTGNIGSVTDHSNGTYTATFTAVTAGTATSISGTINGGSVTTAQPTITVSPGAATLANSVLTVSAGTVASGSGVTLTLTAKDANNNQLATGGLTVAFNHTGGVSTGTIGSTTDQNNGTYTATFTGVTAGSATTLRATIGGSLITTAFPTISVTPGPVSTSTSVLSVASTVASGSGTTATLTAKDANGNTLSGGGLVVAMSRSGGTSTGTFGSVTDNNNGTYTATFTGVVSGTATTLSATIGGNTIGTTLPMITVTPGTATIGNSLVTVSSGTVASASAVTLTLTAKDSNNNSLTSGGLTVVFSNTGGTSTGTISGTTDVGNGTYTATFTGVVAGTATSIRATIGGSQVTTTSPTVTVVPGPANSLKSTVSLGVPSIQLNSSTSVTLVVRDTNNNQLTSGGLTVAFSTTGAGTSTGSFSATVDNGNGTYSSTLTGTGIGNATSVQATIGGVAITSTLPTITVFGYNLEVPIEMLDTGVSSGTTTATFGVSRTNLVTTDYDGTVTYYFEIVASNSSGSDKTVSIIDSSANVLASITTSGAAITRYRTTFTPVAGANNYRVQLASTTTAGQLDVYTARILVKQVNSSITKIYIPMMANTYNTVSTTNPTAIESNSTNNTFAQQTALNYQIWKKDSTRWATLSGSTPWQMDAVLWTNNASRACNAGLFNTNGTQVSTTNTIGTTSTTPALVSSTFADNATNFSNLSSFEGKIQPIGTGVCSVAKLGLWVKLTFSKGEVYYRVDKKYSAIAASTISANSRILLDLSLFNTTNLETYYETTGSATSGSNLTIRLDDHGVADSGTTSPSAVTNCSFTGTNLGTTRALIRSSACSGITNGDRFINEVVRTSGSVSTGSDFVVIRMY